MSLSNALSNALSGIVAASRGTEVVASNLANALTPGFARREMVLLPRPYIAAGGGVHIDGVTRIVRSSVLAQTRIAAAESARSETLGAFHASVSQSLGVPGQPGALSTLLAGFDAALVSAAGRPDSEANLSRLVSTGAELTRAFNRMGSEIQQARSDADSAVASDVQALNANLTRLAELNRQITVQLASGQDANASQDARQGVIDAIARIVPVQEVSRDGGRVALFTASGGVLLDGSTPTRFSFQAAGPITAQMKVGNSPLDVLSIEGTGGAVPANMSFFSGGRLAANLQIRDVDAPSAQARLDAAATDLYTRFASDDVDPTLAGGLPGLFTDGGIALVPGQEPGLAQRLSINPAVNPNTGGALWRLRDGIGAIDAGPVGVSVLLDRMRGALSQQLLPATAGMSAIARTAAGMAADVASAAAATRLDADSARSAAAAQSNAFETMMRQDGVDSDKEMESLLALERAYASNAKVLKAVDDMIQTILRLT